MQEELHRWSSQGYQLFRQGNYAAAHHAFEQALALRQQLLGELHPDTAENLNNLGALHSYQGEYERARPYHARALAIQQRLFPPQHPAIAITLNNLGMLEQ